MAAIDSPVPPYSTPNGVAHVNGNGNGNSIASEGLSDGAASTFDPAILQEYLLALLPPMIGATPAELESLFDDEFNERVHRFSGEGGGVIYIVKKRDEVEGVSIMEFTLVVGVTGACRGCPTDLHVQTNAPNDL